MLTFLFFIVVFPCFITITTPEFSKHAVTYYLSYHVILFVFFDILLYNEIAIYISASVKS